MTKLQSDFIKMIGDAAVSYYKDYGILPSLTIAQAILESKWGRSGLSRDCYNFFGMKWLKGCGCDYKEYETKEQNKDGSYKTIIAKFRKYGSVSEGIRGYYEFLQYKRYRNLRGVTDYKKACDLIRKDGWATSLSYAENLKRYIKQYDLDDYDRDVLGIKKDAKKYVVTASAIKVREGAGISFSQKAVKDTILAQSNPIGKAIYKKGTVIHVLQTIARSDSEIWGRTVDGYVALKYDSKDYVM
ncbi:glycoside hydrolase family 73 protein [Butyrivibrio sp. MB2005]|uniref:glycoside hydrolase family 73 protein n=1 Tax=Butyrivibrio sp. MB2005 TaxID=1280678 RepID=UPI0006842E49|nr:glucosaminidase domain-containing protein [Butyrivibrio sp. MB2005]